MITKHFLPESFDFGMPSVELIGVGSKGLDKQAMVKRATAFDDILADIKPKDNRTYLHVITTGAMEAYGSNLNADAFNETAHEHTAPYPEDSARKTIMLDGGLTKYHDTTYMKDGAVYQEHQTKRAGVDPSGEIVAAKYNTAMHRGELLISVDTSKWASRLQRKARGNNIFLSMGCSVEFDICNICHHKAKTASQHCDHFTKMRGQVLDSGDRCFVINDAPHFYDISGVDVPADRIAFVLRKVASGETTKQASLEAIEHFGSRPAPLYTKAAAIAGKLARMEKIVAGIDDDLPEASEQSDDTEKDFLSRVENYPTDEVIDSCNRKGMLLTPGMLFKLLGRDCEDLDARKLFSECDDDCCGDCSTLMEELDEDEDKNSVLMDGTFDDILPVDLGLDSILERFMPELGMTQPAVNGRVIRITITQMSPRKRQEKRASFTKSAQKALRDTYARYLISFASRNDDATCYNALRKCARFGNCAALS